MSYNELYHRCRDELLAADLAHAREAIAQGSLDAARQRLVGISTYARPSVSIPPNLALEIGAIYRELGFTAMAGYYWYPIEEKSAEMREACRDSSSRWPGIRCVLFSGVVAICHLLAFLAN